MYQLLDGKKLSETLKSEIALEVGRMKSEGKRAPHLTAIMIGGDGASETYVSGKIRACSEVGITSSFLRFESTISEQELISKIEGLNANKEIDGFIIQLPMPAHISYERVVLNLLPEKDVDGFHPLNIGRMVKNLPAHISATPYGIMQLLERYKVPTSGKHCVVLGRSHIAGLPISILLARNSYPGNCTVTLCHSKTDNIREICREADILIAALGKPDFVKADMVKEGAVVIDVGITRVPTSSTKTGYAIKGDVKFDEVAEKCSFITPVPGGVGPMTIVGLMQNTLRAAKGEIRFY